MSNDKDLFNPEYTYMIAKQLKETEEEFAYALISPFCERIVEKKINKKELEKILRKGMQHSIPIEKVKKAREEMEKCSYSLKCILGEDERVVALNNVLIILDKLMEGEEK